MTVSSEAKRTLVKSPPELWSEVSDPESLARHLDGVQQIKITRVEPETAVEWEADGASGSVRLQPSGFGTKVTLSLSRELPATDLVAAECEPASEPESVADSQPVADPVADPEPVAEPEPVAHVEPEPQASEPAVAQTQNELSEPPREGFFARLFKRRHKPVVSAEESIDAPREPDLALLEPESEPMPASEPEPAAPIQEPEATRAPGAEAASEALPEPAAIVDEAEQAIAPESDPAPKPIQPEPSVSADLATLEGEMAKQDEAMLTAMLDRLGAAHHRPFSRS